jgi:ribosomal protein S3
LDPRSNYARKAMLSLKFSEFELPPMQDMLIIGKRASIGPEAVRRMAEALSPDQFSIIKIKHPKIEAVLIRNSLLQMLDEQVLLRIIMEETESMISDTMVLRSELKIEVSVHREVDLS